MDLESEKTKTERTLLYTLSPCPITGHHVTVLSFPFIEFLVWGVVDMAVKVGVREDGVNDFTRVSEPNIIFRRLPFRGASRYRGGALVLEGDVFPLDITEFNCIDLSVEVVVVGDRWYVVVRNKCSGPNFEKSVDLLLSKFRLSEQEIGKFKAGA
jgi:hypothetical protein